MRKRKPSQDREPSKLTIRPSERQEENGKNRPSSSSKELIKKLGEKARSVMRTSPPPDRTQKVSSQPPGQKDGRHPGQPEPGPGPRPTQAVAETEPPSRMSPGAKKVAGKVGGSQDDQAYISQPHMDLTVSSPQAVGEAGGLPRLPSGPHNQTEDKHLDTFQQTRHLARAGWNDPYRHD